MLVIAYRDDIKVQKYVTSQLIHKIHSAPTLLHYRNCASTTREIAHERHVNHLLLVQDVEAAGNACLVY